MGDANIGYIWASPRGPHMGDADIGYIWASPRGPHMGDANIGYIWASPCGPHMGVPYMGLRGGCPYGPHVGCIVAKIAHIGPIWVAHWVVFPKIKLLFPKETGKSMYQGGEISYNYLCPTIEKKTCN